MVVECRRCSGLRGNGTNRQQELVVGSLLPSVVIEGKAQFPQKVNIATSLLLALRILIVNVKSIETIVL